MEQEFEHRMKLVLLKILLNQGRINAPTYDKVKKRITRGKEELVNGLNSG